MTAKRRKILINPRYQLHYALVLSLCFLPLGLLFLFVFWQIFELLMSRLSLVSSSAYDILAGVRSALIWKLVVIELVFWVASFVMGIYMSHRTAGPLYKLALSMRQLREGHHGVELKFRKHDFFMDLAEEFNALAASIQKRNEGEPSPHVQHDPAGQEGGT